MIRSSTRRPYQCCAEFVNVRYHRGGLRSIQIFACKSIAPRWTSRWPTKPSPSIATPLSRSSTGAKPATAAPRWETSRLFRWPSTKACQLAPPHQRLRLREHRLPGPLQAGRVNVPQVLVMPERVLLPSADPRSEEHTSELQ